MSRDIGNAGGVLQEVWFDVYRGTGRLADLRDSAETDLPWPGITTTLHRRHMV